MSLLTFRRDGSSVDTLVWRAAVGPLLVVFTDGTSWKGETPARRSTLRGATIAPTYPARV